jgi:hypothetical protein
MRHESKAERKFNLLRRLQELGFTYEESHALRRIEMTLSRWAEMECGDGNDYASWAIERDETTQKPYRVTYPHSGKSYRHAIADREAGALKRLRYIVAARNARAYVAGNCVNPVSAYHQSDPRGCALYLVAMNDYSQADQKAWIEANPGKNHSCVSFPKLDSCYPCGLAVCA